MLTNNDPKYWQPIGAVQKWLEKTISPTAKVLDIGPGVNPFHRADVFADITDRFDIPRSKLVVCNASEEPLPFKDKAFDFIHCRHVLEDVYNPFLLIHEMSRVGRAGYIETPSPIIELCRGADGTSPIYRGYHHHRWIAWVHDSTMCFVTKYPFVELIDITDGGLEALLRPGPLYWNSYLLWRDEVDYCHFENGVNYEFWPGYTETLSAAITQSKEATDAFWRSLSHPVAKNDRDGNTIPSIPVHSRPNRISI